MAFLTLGTANFFYSYHAVHGTVLNLVMELFVYAVKSIVYKIKLKNVTINPRI